MQLMVGLAVTALALSACDDSVTNPQDLEFAPELGVNLSQMTRNPVGLYYQDEVVGSGALALFGHRVTVEYTGWLHNGQQFDSSTDAGAFIFGPLGQANVIAGWNMGIQGMRAGGRRLLVIPPSLAYGNVGRGATIPGKATRVVRVELTEVTQGSQ
jgi:FKBP-type peptidyl-prolyl cis-trans isomerase